MPSCTDARRAARVALAGLLLAGPASAAAAGDAAAPQRPAIRSNRWQEDWSVLADSRMRREPLDALKYIPLSSDDAKTYLSFGANLRVRYENNDAPQFGVTQDAQDWFIVRSELHADLRVGAYWQGFAQIQSDWARGKDNPGAADKDRLDLEQAFVAYVRELGGGAMKLRAGRQQFAFDLQRFVSTRDGPNLRQSYDALWANYEHGKWRFIGFASQPVQYRDGKAFDDHGNGDTRLNGLRVELSPTRNSSFAGYWLHFRQPSARFANGNGAEARDALDLRGAGTAGNVDWDVEAMRQAGRVGAQDVRAWAFGALLGYTFAEAAWSPRIGVQVDAASGDKRAGDGRLETFNPLYPNGSYLSLSGYSGYGNFVQVKPSLSVRPVPALKLLFAVAPQWRQNVHDAVYTQPYVAVPGTAGAPGRRTGAYAQFRADWAYSRSTAFALEAVHFDVGDAIRNAGGSDGDYLGAQVAFGW
jgi:hypothetical protein